MPSESLHDTPPPHDLDSDAQADVVEEPGTDAPTKPPADLSQFSQRLASFGLGEAPDPLLTESRRPKRRPRG